MGLDPDITPVWLEYIEFLKSEQADSTYFEGQRLLKIRKAYQVLRAFSSSISLSFSLSRLSPFLGQSTTTLLRAFKNFSFTNVCLAALGVRCKVQG